MKRILLILIFVLICMTMIMPSIVNASEVETYDKSVFKFDNTVNFIESANGIGVAAGNTVSFNGISEYATLAGNLVNVNGEVKNDLFVAGNMITFEKNANVLRDSYIAGNIVSLTGNFVRNVVVGGSQVTLNNVIVKGNIEIYAESLVISEGNQITGTIKVSEETIVDSKGSFDTSRIIKIPSPERTMKEKEEQKGSIAGKIFAITNIMVMFSAMYLIFPRLFKKISKIFNEAKSMEYLKTIGIGSLMMIVLPIISIVLLILVAGVQVGLTMLAIYGMMFSITTIITGYIVGDLIKKKLNKDSIKPYLSGLIGIVLVFATRQIPFVGGYITFVSILLTFGIIYKLIMNARKIEE